MQTALVVSLIAFLCFMICHPIAFRVFRTKFRLKLMTGLVVGASVLVIGIIVFLPIKEQVESSPLLLVALAWCIFSFFWLGYIWFYFMVERSVSVRILVQILENGGSIEMDTMIGLYSFDDVVRRRVQQMVDVKMLRHLDPHTQSPIKERFTNTPLGKKLGVITGWSKRLLSLGDGG